MAVQGVEAQVVSVIWVLRPNFVKHDDKLDRILQSHRQAATLGHQNVNTGRGARQSGGILIYSVSVLISGLSVQLGKYLLVLPHHCPVVCVCASQFCSTLCLCCSETSDSHSCSNRDSNAEVCDLNSRTSYCQSIRGYIKVSEWINTEILK